MRILYVIVAGLSLFVAGCASEPQPGTMVGGLPVLVNSSAHPLLPDRVFKQLTAKNRKLVGVAREKVRSLSDGLAVAKAADALPIGAVADVKGWYFYADAVFTDANTGKPVGFISGVAIKHGKKEVIGWSIW
jgi:hypothetical protein